MSTVKSKLSIRKPSENNLTPIILNKALKALVVTAPHSEGGSTTSALTLAQQLTQIRQGKVLYIDASTSRTNLSSKLGLADRRGFLNLTRSPAVNDPRLFIARSTTNEFDFMPLGYTNQPKHNVSLDKTGAILNSLKSNYRFIIIDCDAIYSDTHTLSVSSQADGAILVIQNERTRWEVAQAATERLKQAGANLLGCVYNERKLYMPKWIYENL